MIEGEQHDVGLGSPERRVVAEDLLRELPVVRDEEVGEDAVARRGRRDRRREIVGRRAAER
jgi:hypothetical protein